MAAFTGCVDISAWFHEPCIFEGPDPTIFPNGELPMKKVVLDDSMEIVADFPIASLFFAMAHRRGNAKGVPAALMRVQLGPEGQRRGVSAGSLIPRAQQHTVAFVKRLTPENYAELKDVVIHEIKVDVGQRMLDFGYALLKKDILIDGVNKWQESRNTV